MNRTEMKWLAILCESIVTLRDEAIDDDERSAAVARGTLAVAMLLLAHPELAESAAA